MKRKCLFLCLLLAFSCSSFGQMVAEHTYSSLMPGIGIVVANGGTSVTGPVLVDLDVSGRKYAVCEASHLNLYNLDYSLWKTIPLPAGVTNAVIFFISENLFKLDGLVQYAISYPDASGTQNMYVKDELGTTLNTVSGMYWMYVYKSSPTATKAILWNSSSPGMVFGLPGNLPCAQCGSSSTTGTATLNGTPDLFISDPTPNPATDQARIIYRLTAGIQEAKIVLYNALGQVVKSYRVGADKESIEIGVKDLPQGMYNYSLQTPVGNTIAKNLIVIN